MTILLWWALASTGVSLFVGAFLEFGRHEPETLDLDVVGPIPAAPAPVTALSDR
jgi:hypothetical protein